jgi:translation initiation factor 2 beta subunit (eIF-2beta)/eIF-5
MIKIICTSEKEKLELIEASDAINRHWATNPKASKDKMTEFLLNLYKNPGNIEVAEKVVVNKSFVYDKIDKAKDEK